MTFKLSREPAIYLTLFATALRLFSAFVLNLTPDHQAVLNAVAVAVAGAFVAIIVRRDGQVPALVGVIQALLALAVGFGWHQSAENQAIIMSFVGLLAAAFVRTQATASVDAEGVPRG